VVGLEGYPGRTEAGEFSLVAKKAHLLAKCEHNMPMMNWTHKSTLKDGDVRFQKRFLDLIVNNDVKQIFQLRAKLIRSLRNFLDTRDFLEVETPILNS
jgi:lysyl-tRNA synthetase class 2